ncbi:hypothetical protein Tco_0810125 [Tanacetum coccineum]
MKSVIKCTTSKAIWSDLILAHEGPSDKRDTKIATLRLKFKAFKALEGEKVNGTPMRLKFLLNDLENNGVSISQAEDSDSDIEEDQRSSSEFLADLNAEFHERALLANQRRFCKRPGRNQCPLMMKGVTTFKALMTIADEELSVGRADASVSSILVALFPYKSSPIIPKDADFNFGYPWVDSSVSGFGSLD